MVVGGLITEGVLQKSRMCVCCVTANSLAKEKLLD